DQALHLLTQPLPDVRLGDVDGVSGQAQFGSHLRARLTLDIQAVERLPGERLELRPDQLQESGDDVPVVLPLELATEAAVRVFELVRSGRRALRARGARGAAAAPPGGRGRCGGVAAKPAPERAPGGDVVGVGPCEHQGEQVVLDYPSASRETRSPPLPTPTTD